MLKTIRRALATIFLSLVSIVVLTTSVVAATPPDEGPYILKAHAFQNYLVSGDMLVMGYYNIPYVSLPGVTATETFIGRLIYGGAELTRTAPYAYAYSGYRQGTFWLYLDESTAPTWGSGVTLELSGNPTLDWGGVPPKVSTTSITYHTTSSIEDTKVALRANILLWAVELGTSWTLTMVENPATGSVLSAVGESYFVNAVPQLRVAVPTLFQQSISVVTYVDLPTATKSTVGNLKSKWPFDWSGLSDWIGLPSEEVLTTGIFLLLAVGLAGLVGSRSTPQSGVFSILPAFPLAAGLGMISIIWAALFAVAAVIASAFVIFLLRSG